MRLAVDGDRDYCADCYRAPRDCRCDPVEDDWTMDELALHILDGASRAEIVRDFPGCEETLAEIEADVADCGRSYLDAIDVPEGYTRPREGWIAYLEGVARLRLYRLRRDARARACAPAEVTP